MPSRILREGILTSPRMAQLGWAEEVFYRRLHSVVDDFGRYFADAGMLRAACYPRQLNKVSDSDIGKWLQSIAAAGLVRVYPAQDGERYLEVLDFGQQVRAKKSKFPDPPIACVADAQQVPIAPPAPAPVSVSVSEGVAEVASSSPPEVADVLFARFWAECPRKVGKDAARKAFDKRKPDAALVDRMIVALRVQCQSPQWLKDDGQFIPHPSTWLNEGRWQDEATTANAPPSKAADQTAEYLAKEAEHARLVAAQRAARQAANTQGTAA